MRRRGWQSRPDPVTMSSTMLRSLPFAFLSLSIAVRAQDAAAPPLEPPAALQTIRKADLLAHATWLADDARGGRLTGSPGQIEAANYIAEHFASLGLEPLGDEVDGERGWLQHYGITRTHVLDRTVVKVGSLELRDGFAILGGKPIDVHVTAKARWCGLGRLRGPKADVAEGESLEGQVAVVAVRPPRGRIDRELTTEQKFGMSFALLGQLGMTVRRLEGAGAAAVLFVMAADPMGLSDVLNYVALSPGKDVLAPRFDGGDGTMAELGHVLGGGGVPALVLSLGASARLCEALGIAPDALAAFVGGDGERPVAKDADADLVVAVAHEEDATACNVVAVLRGSDPQLADEAVVFSAHMDHVGRRMDGEIYNGADDNASGSAGLLQIAAAFAKSEQKPRRSVIFLSVSGEELGLWGSAFFAEHPTWPVERLVANVNTDMIGRSGPESGPHEVLVTPSHERREYSTLVRDSARFAAALGLSFASGDKYYERSDHYNFAKQGIPVVFFCNGEHADYHQVTDTADKLDGDKMERLARLAFWTGWDVANADARPRQLGSREDWR